jgi:hypothetical protein
MQDFPFKRRVGMFLGMLCLYVPLILGWVAFLNYA